MENETRRLQKLILSISNDITELCEKNHIMYSMSGGTLLGAIRHNGFIPWDDDLDLCMDRDNYERFIQVCKTQLDSKKYYLQTMDTERYYGFAFAKIQLKGTEIIEDFSANVKVNHGIFIDIFPYDSLPDGRLKCKLFLAVNHIYKNMQWIKCGYGSKKQKKKLSYFAFKILSSFYSIEAIKKKRYKHIIKYNDLQTQSIFLSDYPDEIIPAKWIDNLKYYPFEDRKMKGFCEARKYLKTIYGSDYMQLPPIEKRVQHSRYKIDFGPY